MSVTSGNVRLGTHKSRLETPALIVDLDVMERNLRKMAKVFEGEELPDLIVDLRQVFAKVKPHYPAATRREGREVFLVCQQRHA